MQEIILRDRTPDQNPAIVYLAGLSAGTRSTARGSLNLIAGMLSNGKCDATQVEWSGLRFQHTAAIRSKLAEVYKPGTANKILSYMRGVIRTAWRLGLMSAEDYHRAVDVKSVVGKTLPAGRDIGGDEVEALMDACAKDGSAAGRRDAAIIGLLRAGGLRRAEIVALKLDDVDLKEGRVRVIGKRNKERLVFVANGALESLRDWVDFRGREQGALFCPINKSGKINIRHMRPENIRNMVIRRGKEALLPKHLTPHDFRRTLVGDLLSHGEDIVTVQKIVGHSSVNTTGRYDRRGDEMKRKAIAKIHVPYRRVR